MFFLTRPVSQNLRVNVFLACTFLPAAYYLATNFAVPKTAVNLIDTNDNSELTHVTSEHKLERSFAGKVVDAANTEFVSKVIEPWKSDPACSEFSQVIHRRSNVFPGGVQVGFMTDREVCMLYLLALWSPGHIGEYGPYVGKSTSTLAQGIKDSGGEKSLTTADLFVAQKTEFDRGTVPTIHEPYYCKTNDNGLVGCYNEGYLFFEADSNMWAQIGPYHDNPGGILSWLVANLNDQKLLHYVHIVKGPHLPPIAFRVIFCDTAHTVTTIRKNFWAWNSHIHDGRPIVFAFHDTTPENEAELKKLWSSMGPHIRVDSLFVFQVSQAGHCDPSECPRSRHDDKVKLKSAGLTFSK
jgi:hypothetical protein